MGDVVRGKIVRYEIFSILIVVLIIVVLGITSYVAIQYVDNEREIRVETNRFLMKLQDDIEYSVGNKNEIAYPYCVLNKNGEIISSTMDLFEADKRVSLKTVGGNGYYTTLIMQKDSINGILLVDAKCNQKNQKELLVAGVLVSLILLIIFVLFRVKILKMQKCDIWEPMEQLHKTTKSILNGNLNEKITYDYLGEIGMLCHDFEKMRDEIRVREEREKENYEKERVLYASISHDLNTPLAIVRGYLEQIIYEVIVSQDEIKRVAKNALTKIVGINRLISDILEHSKASMNQLLIVKKECYANEFFGELLREYLEDSENKKYEIKYNTPPEVIIEIDENRISQVMQNIIGNSQKYAKEELEIKVDFEIIEERNNGRILVVGISDNGNGISAEDLPHIFDLFYRGDKARTQNVPGSGMGLNISKYIVEQHGGRIECDSIVGIGTKISFSIPIL